MKVIEPGHIYQLQHLDGSGAGILVFVNREPGTEHEGVQTQEILRALIDRTEHCNSCLHWDGNKKIIHHLRMALALHESRALERKTEKGELKPETVLTGSDGHFSLPMRAYWCGCSWSGLLPYPQPREIAMCPRCDCATAVPRNDEIVGGTRHATRAAERVVEKAPDPLLTAFRYGEPKTTDYCKRCGESPDSATHQGLGDNEHSYVDPRPYECKVPMCGESGVCEECRKRGAR